MGDTTEVKTLRRTLVRLQRKCERYHDEVEGLMDSLHEVRAEKNTAEENYRGCVDTLNEIADVVQHPRDGDPEALVKHVTSVVERGMEAVLKLKQARDRIKELECLLEDIQNCDDNCALFQESEVARLRVELDLAKRVACSNGQVPMSSVEDDMELIRMSEPKGDSDG